MEPTKLIDQIVSTHLKPALLAKGFRKQGSTFWRDRGEVIDVMTVQKSQWNDGQAARFTVNMGVYWKRIHELLGEPVKTIPPKENQCTVRERLGCLDSVTAEFPDGRDHWWEVTATTDLAATGGEVLERIERSGIPWLDRLHDLEATLAHIEAHKMWRIDDAILDLRKRGLL
jgi:hypothetical protein